MTEIKPVYQVQQLGEWIEVDKSIFDELYIQNKFPHRILYPAAAYEALQKENAFVINDLHIARSHIGTLKTENEAHAKRIAELEQKDEMLDDILDLLKISKENWFNAYSCIACMAENEYAASKNGDSK